MSDNKRIAKNSLLLYIRLIISIVIGLYTSRLVLLALGADDYGLYAVVGGIVGMLNFLNTSMSSTTSRYLAVEIGKYDKGNPNKAFNTSLVIHIIFIFVLVFFAETVGVWYINNHLNIAPDRISDARFVLHLSVLATVFSVLSTPFQGLITINEKFNVRVIIEIFRTLLRLVFVIWLVSFTGDKLLFYAVMMVVVTILPSVLFIGYCYIYNIDIVRWKWNPVKSDYYDMLSFTGWILLGTIAYLGVRQGAAVIINIFFGTALNASFGIASQVFNYITMFVQNLRQAAVPQIMKSHSSGDDERSMILVYAITKYSFFVMLIPTIPLMLSINSVLEFWLKDVPEYTKSFVILMLINGLISSLGSGFDSIFQAAGQIKKVQTWYSIVMLATLPMAYLVFSFDYPPYSISIVMIFATLVLRVIFLKEITKLTSFTMANYLKKQFTPLCMWLFWYCRKYIYVVSLKIAFLV